MPRSSEPLVNPILSSPSKPVLSWSLSPRWKPDYFHLLFHLTRDRRAEISGLSSVSRVEIGELRDSPPISSVCSVELCLPVLTEGD